MRTLPLNARQAMFAQESGEVWLWLLTITHPELADPIRISTDPTTRLTTTPLVYGTTSRGNDYLFVEASVSVPDENDRSPPASTMTISNVSRELIPLARSVTSPPQVQLEAVFASDPDTVLLEIPRLDMIGLRYNAQELTFSLAMDAFANEPFPAGSFTPADFPGLFT